MSASLRTLLDKLTRLNGRIANAETNLKKLGTANINAEAVDIFVSRLDSNWQQFEDTAEALESQHRAELPKALPDFDDMLELVEQSYTQQKVKLAEWKKKVTPVEAAPQRIVKTEDDGVASRKTVAPLQLPHFSGQQTEWPEFRELFQSIISQQKGLTDVDRLHYLKMSLKGSAAGLLRNIPTLGANYQRAWAKLETRYENQSVLVDSYWADFVAIQKMKSCSESEVRRVLDAISNTVESVAGIGRPISSNEDLFVHLSLALLDDDTRREWRRTVSGSANPPTAVQLITFLERWLKDVIALHPKKPSREGAKPKASSSVNHAAATRDHSKSICCPLCKQNHLLFFCKVYQKKSPAERKCFLTEQKRCHNCLAEHLIADCKSTGTCKVCHQQHHTTLHEAFRVADNVQVANVTALQVMVPNTVLLATARVLICDKFGDFCDARAFIDQGANTSLVTESFVRRLRLPRRRSSVKIFGIGGQVLSRGQVTLTLMANRGTTMLEVTALILPKLPAFSECLSLDLASYPHLRGLELADPHWRSGDPCQLLLGASVYSCILQEGLKRGISEGPIAQLTTLGWIVSGVIDSSPQRHIVNLCSCASDERLLSLVQSLWQQEELPQSTGALTSEEEHCEKLFVDTHTRQQDGRYVVRLPVVRPLPAFTDSKQIAIRCLNSMERRFKRDELLRDRYVQFMTEYLTLGHMSPVDNGASSSPPAAYLPHHGVLRTIKETTKLRVVFNGSASLPSGATLNQHLLVGPNLLPAIFDVLLRWRYHCYVFVSDVEKMYRQILVHPMDRPLQSIVWRFGPDDPVSEYQLNTVTYGLACAPYLAMRTLHQLAIDEGDKFPVGARVLSRDVYMDDILSGADSEEEASLLIHELIGLCKAGGFPLKKWSANRPSLLFEVPSTDRQEGVHSWEPHESHSTLGLQWHPSLDCFSFTVRVNELRPISKRTVLSQTAQLFDPLGWIAPITVRSKILLQSLWLQGIEWDAPLRDGDRETWSCILRELPLLQSLRIPRWLGTSNLAEIREIHGFSDASERAYAAVVFLKITCDDKTRVTLLAAKTKVAPLKQISLPRLELCGAALLTDLVKHITTQLDLNRAALHLWSDSTVVLSWIKGHPTRWKTFVANRVSLIQRELPKASWHHISGKENPADLASRGCSPSELLNNNLWWRGPAWLATAGDTWSTDAFETLDRLPDERNTTAISNLVIATPYPDFLTRFSSLRRLLRVTAWCLRWRNYQKRLNVAEPHSDRVGLLSVSEVENALKLWIRLIQEAAFKKEVDQLRNGQAVARGSIIKLQPLLDADGILRVGGRLRHSLLPSDRKHPIILPKSSPFTHLVVKSSQDTTLHGGVQLTLAHMRQTYWVPGGRTVVKSCIHNCLRCLRWRAASAQQLMGDLPSARVTPSRPFSHVGVDYAGPILLRTSRGRGHKAMKGYMSVFVCLSTRAIHLEAVSDYSADAFLAALQRFISRRGLCQILYSDCGTTFTGADAKLCSLFNAKDAEGRRLFEGVEKLRIQWKFNPPASPHFGGIWEAAVKGVKHHLRRVLGDATLTYEEMTTLLAMIEACLNSRPLQALSDDPDDQTALTPGHFLIGSPLNAIPEPSLADVSVNRLTRWEMLQKMRDHFWHRWSQEYLSSLLSRPKWWTAHHDIAVGRLCLIRNETTSPCKWPLARVIATHPGSDGLVRVVTLRTAHSELQRPIAKIIPLPVKDS